MNTKPEPIARYTTPEENLVFWEKHNPEFAIKLRAYYAKKGTMTRTAQGGLSLDWLG